jgi:hypothetical protein
VRAGALYTSSSSVVVAAAVEPFVVRARGAPFDIILLLFLELVGWQTLVGRFGWLATAAGAIGFAMLPAPRSFLPPCVCMYIMCVWTHTQSRRTDRTADCNTRAEREEEESPSHSLALHVIWVVVCSNRSVLYVSVCAEQVKQPCLRREFFLAARRVPAY